MAVAGSTEIGQALFDAVASARARLGDATAEVAVITPSTVNGALARRELGLAGAFIRVQFVTVGGLVATLAAPVLRERKVLREPAGWMRTTLAKRVRDGALPGGYESVLSEPGWMAALVAAVGSLESGGLDASALRGVAHGGKVQADVATRSDMLAALLDAIAEARARDSLAGPREEAAAALEAIRQGSMGARGAVLLGDARGTRLTSEVLTHWLASRPTVRLDLPALAELPAAEHGLAKAATHAEVRAVDVPTAKVSVVRTPDPVREMAEAVREAQRAVASGTPLDRIAIVLPDPSEVVTLREALDRATLPATYLTGPSLVRTPAARFLLHALDLVLGNDDVRAWHELLRQPALRLRARLGEDTASHRGRFRRILARSRALRRTDRICSAVESWAAGLEVGPTDDERQRTETSRAAAAALSRAIRSVHEDLTTLREPRSLGRHARGLAAFLAKWWIPSADARAVATMLADVGRFVAGAPITLDEAVATVREMLEATEYLEGSLRDPALRVLSPMQLTGGAFDLVVVTGVTEGRFPAKPSEDPIVPDVLVDALDAAHGAGLFRSTDRVLLERRRLAAIRSAARSELWLSAPRVDMLEGRPLLPGSLLFELLTETTGARSGFRVLEATAELRGRRSRPWPSEAAGALGTLEHLLSRLHSGDAAARQAALEALADHPTSRRLLVRARAFDRLAAGEVAAALAPWADRVDPAVMACLGLRGEQALSPGALDQLMRTPRAFLLRRMLGAWPAPSFLSSSWSPSAPWVWRAELASRAEDVVSDPAWTPRQLRDALHDALARDAARAGLDATDELARVDRIAERATTAIAAAQPASGLIAALDDVPLDPSMPWLVSEGRARRLGAALGWLVEEIPGPRSVQHATVQLLEAAAQRARGSVDALVFVDMSGARRDADDAGPLIADVVADAQLATRAARLGLYPAKAAAAELVDAWAEVFDAEAAR